MATRAAGQDMTHFYALLKSPATGGFTATFPDFPGCIATGHTEDEVLRVAGEALGRHAKQLVQEGSPIPQPSSFMATVAKLATDNKAVIYPVLMPTIDFRQAEDELVGSGAPPETLTRPVST
jgi:predicted RNase H-like HicB family nuclease